MATNPFDTSSASTPTQGQAPKDTSFSGMTPQQQMQGAWTGLGWDPHNANQYRGQRSEERRVGKECRL